MLWKKMFRDILGNKGSYLSCLVLIILGLMIFMGFSIANDNLSLAKNTLYREQNFAHGFAEVESMLKRDVAGLADIEGVEQVTGRFSREVRVYDPEADESIYLRLISQNLADPGRLNNVMLLEGEDLMKGERCALLDTSFAEAHQLKPGETLEIVYEGKLEEINFRGTALGPEFAYLLRSETEIYPNPDQFGVALLPLDTMWDLFPDMQDRVNDLVFSLEPGAEYHVVEEELKRELEAYGLNTIYPREDHSSHFILQEEIEVIEMLGSFFPLIILGVAGFIIFILLKRLVEQQRTQIGILKATGYSNREVLFHYLSFSLALAVAGGLVGGLVGMWIANPLTSMLYDFFKLPEIFAGFTLNYLLLGIALALVVMGLAGFLGACQVLKLAPAEAMRPPAPPSGKKTVLEKFAIFTEMLTVQGKMAVRNLGRSPARSTFMFFGISVSCAMVAFTWSLANEAMPTFMFHQYDYVETYDARINLASPQPREAAGQEVAAHPEVSRVEPMAEVPVTLSSRWLEEDVKLLGLTREGRLYNILDEDNNRILPSSDGLILSERLGENLDVKPGDTVEVDSPFFREEVYLEVIKTIPQYIGMNAYMELSAVEEITRQGSFATSLLVEGSSGSRAVASSLTDTYRKSENVAGIDGWLSLRKMLEEEWEAAGSVIYLLVLIGIIFSFSIIYVSSFIILSERNRELASMRVLGMTSREVLSVITFEQWFISFFALLAGIPLAHLIHEAFAREWTTDMYSIPAGISTAALLTGVLVTVASIWVAQRFALYKVQKLDLVEVLKSRE